MLFLKGIIIGIGKIIPGVSGSMLAISLGIYQKLIDSINNLFKITKDNLKFLVKISLGVIVSIILFSKIILSLLDSYYLITMLFFVGLIIGGFDDISKNIKKSKSSIIIVILSFVLVTILGIINIKNELTITNPILFFIFFIFIGFVDAVTTVVPGISGTATLMMLGAYTKVITTFSNVFNFELFKENILVLIPFSIGFILGIVLTAKLISYLFKKHNSNTYSCILGFSVSTIVLMVIRSLSTPFLLKDLIIAIIFLIIGIFITKKINHLFSD